MSRQPAPLLIPAVAALVAAVVLAGAALADSTHAPTVQGRPALAGHNFTETVDAPSPLVRSYLRNRLGGGKYGNTVSEPIMIGGREIIALRGSLLYVNLDFEYQYAIKPWLATRFRFLGAGRLGSDTLALLSEGLTMTTGYEFGWLIRLREGPRSALSLDLSLSDRGYTGVNIVSFVEDVINGDPAALVRKVPAIRGGAGLRHGWALSPLLGVTSRVMTGYAEAVDRSRTDVWFWNFAVSLDCDLRSPLSVPLGVAAGFTYDTFPEFSSDIADGMHSVFIRLSYLGRNDFLFSLDLMRDVVPLTAGPSKFTGTSVTLGLRYYL